MRLNKKTAGTTFILGLALWTQSALSQSKCADNPTPKIDFEKTILPIFLNSCFSCHAPKASDPLMVNAGTPLDRKRALEIMQAEGAFEMGTQFPFPDDRTPKLQLGKIEKKLRRSLMPPESQKELGLGAPLKEEDRKKLLEWISQSRKTVSEK